MSKSNENFLITKLKDVIEELKTQVNDFNFIHCKKEFNHFLYFHKQNIVKVIPELKTKLKELFQLSCYSGIQIIGDSAVFSDEAHQFLLEKLAKLKTFKGLIFYGFTGEGANGIVTDLIEKEIVLTEKVIANIVANESLKVIEKFQCRYSEKIQNFFIVDDGKGGCQFGDDINLSDSLASQLICLEGGVISFGQILNTLMLHEQPQITMYTGLRNKDNANLERSLFSASELFLTLKQAIHDNSLKNYDQFEKILNDYLKMHRLNPLNNHQNEFKQKQIQVYFDQFKQLTEETQGKIINKIKAIKVINYLEECSSKKANQGNLLQASLTQLFITPKEFGSRSEFIPCESLKVH